MSERGAEDVDLVIAAQQGDGDAFGQLYDRWFDRVHDVSRRVVRDPGMAAEVTQDVFLVTWRQLGTLRQPESFGGWLLRATRNRSLNRLERERRSVALGDEETVMEIDRQAPAAGSSVDQPDDVLDRSESEEMVWAAAAALGDRDASILHLHLRHGLDGVELAEELDVSPNAANQAMFRLRNRLGGAIRAWLLWRHGHPACERLADVLTTAGTSQFGAEAVRVITAHADDCERCGRDRAALVAPETLFAAVPILAAPLDLKVRVAGALRAEGVPISSSFTASDPAQDQTIASEVASASEETGNDAAASRELKKRLAVAGVLLLVTAGGSLAWVSGQTGGGGEPIAIAAPDGTSPRSATTVDDTPSTTSSPATIAVTTSATPVPSAPAAPPSEPSPPTTSGAAPLPPPPPAPAPVITSFTGARVPVFPGECATGSERIELSWATESTDYVTISGPDEPTGRLPATGTAVTCTPVEAVYELTAVGSDTSVTRAITVP